MPRHWRCIDDVIERLDRSDDNAGFVSSLVGCVKAAGFESRQARGLRVNLLREAFGRLQRSRDAHNRLRQSLRSISNSSLLRAFNKLKAIHVIRKRVKASAFRLTGPGQMAGRAFTRWRDNFLERQYVIQSIERFVRSGVIFSLAFKKWRAQAAEMTMLTAMLRRLQPEGQSASRGFRKWRSWYQERLNSIEELRDAVMAFSPDGRAMRAAVATWREMAKTHSTARACFHRAMNRQLLAAFNTWANEQFLLRRVAKELRRAAEVGIATIKQIIEAHSATLFHKVPVAPTDCTPWHRIPRPTPTLHPNTPTHPHPHPDPHSSTPTHLTKGRLGVGALRQAQRAL